MEQLVARRAHNPKVVGSSPAPATESDGLDKTESVRFFLALTHCLSGVLGVLLHSPERVDMHFRQNTIFKDISNR